MPMEATDKRIVPNDVMLGEVRKMIAEGHSVTIKVKGVSMLPFIVGDRDSVRLVKPSHLKVRDIALAEIDEGHYVLHRIKRIEPTRITLMGDGNLRGLEFCRPKDIAGKVEVIFRNGKSIDPWASSEQRKVGIWLALTPIRRILLAIYRRTIL
ncbi:MAG: S24/S26 family peptidase [Bacteroidaceae bacterium]|nr:S24/S26 family peptidase [Bacteroidaceae bacterium]